MTVIETVRVRRTVQRFIYMAYEEEPKVWICSMSMGRNDEGKYNLHQSDCAAK